VSFIHISLLAYVLFGGDQKFLEKSPLLIRYKKVVSLECGWSLTTNLPSDVTTIPRQAVNFKAYELLTKYKCVCLSEFLYGLKKLSSWGGFLSLLV
jgi:hypothetical protein